MFDKLLPVAITVAFSAVGVLSDYFLKLASREDDSLRTPLFYLGFVLYASTAFGWLYVMKHLKLATVGVLYSVSTMLLLAVVGMITFKETLNAAELAGMAMAIGSVFLLVRFG